MVWIVVCKYHDPKEHRYKTTIYKYDCDFYELLNLLQNKWDCYIFDNPKAAFIFYTRQPGIYSARYVLGAIAYHTGDVIIYFDPEKNKQYIFYERYRPKDRKVYLYTMTESGYRGFYSTHLRDIYNGKQLLETLRKIIHERNLSECIGRLITES